MMRGPAARLARAISSMDSEKAGRRIQALREERGWTIPMLRAHLLAMGVDLSEQTLAKIEHGVAAQVSSSGIPYPRKARWLSFDEACAFADVFGVSLDELRSNDSE